MTLPIAQHYTLEGEEPRLRHGAYAESVGARRLGELEAVLGTPIDHTDRESIQYWTFSGVGWEHDRNHLAELPFAYDLTALAARTAGWECAKTHGHAHTATTAVEALPELYEVLEGDAGFLVQDLEDGPRATFAALIEAGTGDVVAIPAHLQHCTLNLGESTLVVADVVARTVHEDYARLRAARGMAYLIAPSGEATSNSAYLSASPLLRFRAADWSPRARTSLYQLLLDDSEQLGWLMTGAIEDGPFSASVAQLLGTIS